MDYGTDDKVGRILSTQAKLKSDRANFESMWQSVAEFVLPNDSDFTAQWSEGTRRTERIMDSTAPEALKHGCAALESMACPASSIWHRLRPADPALRRDTSVMQWCDNLNDILIQARNAPKANFQGQIGSSLQQFMAFGNGPFMVDDVVGYGLRYQTLHLAECWGIENSAGVIDTIYRERNMTAVACVDALNRGYFDDLPADIHTAAQDAKRRTDKFKFFQCIEPNGERDSKRKDFRGMAFSSTIVSVTGKSLVKQSGYRTQPIMYPRFRVAPKETYGRGPGMDVLPEILMLNQMRKAFIRQAQRAIEPPILAADDGSLPPFSLRGNAINYGTLSADGKALVQAFNVGGNFEINKEILDDSRRMVQTAFFNDVFSILIEHPEMTATEVLQRAQEQGQLVSPVMGRIQAEWFGPMIDRELDILDQAGNLPPPPDKVRNMGGIHFEVVYEGQIQVAQRKTKALAISSTLQQMAPLIENDQSGAVLRSINFARTAAAIGDANGAPADMFNTPEELGQAEADAASKEQLAAIAATAGPVSSAIKNIADAQRAGMSVTPGNIPGAP